MNEYQGFVCAPGDAGKIAIIVSRFNGSITEKLLEGALAKLRENMVKEEQISVVRVPGAFEIPTIAQRFALDEEYIAVICLGCVIKGETPHDEHINRAVSLELARVGAEYGIPVIFGILTCNTVEQALARSGQLDVSKDKAVDARPGNKGAEAAEAALEMIDLLGKLPEMKFDEEDEKDGDYASEAIERNAARYVRGDFETVDVDPDELVEIDEDDDADEEAENDDEDGDDEPWFLRGGSGSGFGKGRGDGDRRSERKHGFGGDRNSKRRGDRREYDRDVRSDRGDRREYDRDARSDRRDDRRSDRGDRGDRREYDRSDRRDGDRKGGFGGFKAKSQKFGGGRDGGSRGPKWGGGDKKFRK